MVGWSFFSFEEFFASEWLSTTSANANWEKKDKDYSFLRLIRMAVHEYNIPFYLPLLLHIFFRCHFKDTAALIVAVQYNDFALALRRTFQDEIISACKLINVPPECNLRLSAQRPFTMWRSSFCCFTPETLGCLKSVSPGGGFCWKRKGKEPSAISGLSCSMLAIFVCERNGCIQ